MAKEPSLQFNFFDALPSMEFKLISKKKIPQNLLLI